MRRIHELPRNGKHFSCSIQGVAIALAALAIVTDRSWYQIVAMSLSLSAVSLAVIAHILKTKFERSYQRH